MAIGKKKRDRGFGGPNYEGYNSLIFRVKTGYPLIQIQRHCFSNSTTCMEEVIGFRVGIRRQRSGLIN